MNNDEMPLLIQADQAEENGQWERAAWLKATFLRTELKWNVDKMFEHTSTITHQIYFEKTGDFLYISVRSKSDQTHDWWCAGYDAPKVTWTMGGCLYSQPPIIVRKLIEDHIGSLMERYYRGVV